MSANMSQKEYLKKYLSGGKSKDVKKKKKKRAKGAGLQIIDDDIDVSKLRPLDSAEIDILLDGNEDAPQIAGIVDDRPEEVKKMEQFRLNSKWRVLTQDDGFNSKVKIEEVKGKIIRADGQSDADISPPRNASEKTNIKTGTMDKQKKRETRHDSDESPLTHKRYPAVDKFNKNSNNSTGSNNDSPPRKKTEKNHHKRSQQSDTDESPPRKSRQRKAEKSDSDSSPPRKFRQRKSGKSDSDASPPRKSRQRKSEKSDSDASPPRKSKQRKSERPDSDASPPRKSRQRKSEKSESDATPPRKCTKKKSEKSDSDTSPPRKSKRRKSERPDSDTLRPRKSGQRKSEKSDSDQSPVRKRRLGNESEGDISPPRKTTKRTERKSRWGYFEDPDKEKSGDTKLNSNNEKRRSHHSPGASPPRRKRNDHSPNRRRDVSQDLSPPRKTNMDVNERYRDSDSHKKDDQRDKGHSQSSSTRQERTSDGRKAGFRDAKQFFQEDAEFKRREHDMLQNMGDDVSGRNAQTVARKTGRKRQPSIDKEEQKRDLAKQKEREEKYSRWGRGLKQTEEREGRVQDYLHESNKPLARYRDDEDLEGMLRKQEREGDPMANYMRDKEGDSGNVAQAKPIYKGSYPPNRFHIRPGYRWDGVDRSSGYEKKYFETKNSKIALEKDAYKWSTEDM